MKLRKYIDLDLLQEMTSLGYIGQQLHPAMPFAIYNYTHKAQYDRVWNDATKKCRGLIVQLDQRDSLAGAEIVAKPWPKFFNYGEHAEDTLDLDAPCRVFDKLDGSLGILYPGHEGWAIATRGSFTSEQAMRATQMLERQYCAFKPVPEYTYLFEVIYPSNRIVVDYEHAEKLVLLDVLETETGLQAGGAGWYSWPGEWAKEMNASTLRQALALEPRKNAEGVVVRFVDGAYNVDSSNHPGMMVKIKQEDYVALHRIVTGLNERTVWERTGAGESVAQICEGLPDEFEQWVRDVYDDLWVEANRILTEAHHTHWEICDTIGWKAPTRKAYALQAVKHPELSSYLFMILDRKPNDVIWSAIWKTLRPAGNAPRVFSEDTA